MRFYFFSFFVFLASSLPTFAATQNKYCEELLSGINTFVKQSQTKKTEFWDDQTEHRIDADYSIYDENFFRRYFRERNGNYEPTYFASDEDQILEFSSRFSRAGSPAFLEKMEPGSSYKGTEEEIEALREARDFITNQWVFYYMNFKKDIDNLIDNEVTLHAQLWALKKQLELKVDWDDFILPIIRDGAFAGFVEYPFQNAADVKVKINKLDEQIKSQKNTWFNDGFIQHRKFEQALIRSNLEILRNRLLFYKRNEVALGNVFGLEQEAVLQTIEELLDDQALNPDTKSVKKLERKIFWRELRGLQNSESVKKFKNFYEGLNSMEKMDLGDFSLRSYISSAKIAIVGTLITTVSVAAINGIMGGNFNYKITDIAQTHYSSHLEVARTKLAEDRVEALLDHMKRQFPLEFRRVMRGKDYDPFKKEDSEMISTLLDEVYEYTDVLSYVDTETLREDAFRQRIVRVTMAMTEERRRFELAGITDDAHFEDLCRRYVAAGYITEDQVEGIRKLRLRLGLEPLSKEEIKIVIMKIVREKIDRDALPEIPIASVAGVDSSSVSGVESSGVANIGSK